MAMKTPNGSFLVGPGDAFHLIWTIDRLVIAERALGLQRPGRPALCQFRRGGRLDGVLLTALDANHGEIVRPGFYDDRFFGHERPPWSVAGVQDSCERCRCLFRPTRGGPPRRIRRRCLLAIVGATKPLDGPWTVFGKNL